MQILITLTQWSYDIDHFDSMELMIVTTLTHNEATILTFLTDSTEPTY